MTAAQIKKAQIAKITKTLKASGNFTPETLKNAVKLTYEAIQTPAEKRTIPQQVMVAAFTKQVLEQDSH